MRPRGPRGLATVGPAAAIAARFKLVTAALCLSAHPIQPAAPIRPVAPGPECARRCAPSCCPVQGVAACPLRDLARAVTCAASRDLHRLPCATRRNPLAELTRSVRLPLALSVRVAAGRRAASRCVAPCVRARHAISLARPLATASLVPPSVSAPYLPCATRRTPPAELPRSFVRFPL